jgi:DMSO/TMAO reductase YedYZ molybdopterin-dependent catalytic subunit
LPEWDLTLEGATTDVISQGEFEDGLACHGPVTWDDEGDIWSGMPLWLLVGWVDDATQHGPGAFNDALATAGYNITVYADDGYSQTFSSADVARNNDMIVANILNGAPLPPDRYPLRLFGPELAGYQKVGQIVRIELTDIPTPTATPTPSPTATASPTPTPTPVPQDWPLTLEGGLTDIVQQSEFEADVAAHPVNWDDGGNIWQGLALWRLAAKVDDDNPETFNDELATTGYGVIVIAADGYSRAFASADVAHNDNMIVANTLNGAPLSSDYYPLRLVGPELSGGQKVSQIVRIELDGVPTVSEGGCFIATAAYGSYLDSHVDTLRSFRDSHMQTDAMSSELVSLYYRISPSIADFIDEHSSVKPIVRAALLPAVATSEVATGSNLAAKAAVLGFMGIVSVAAVAWVWRRRQLVNS